ncbi:MAG: TolC family protein [Bacteroidales bacterium]
MNRLNSFLLLVLFLLVSGHGAAQLAPRQLTLDEVISIAQQQSPDALSAKNRFLKAFWEMRRSEALLLPKLYFDATLPSYNRSIQKITLDDGSDVFRERALLNTTGDISLSKVVGITGGEVYLRSGLVRIDYLADSTPTSWLSTPMVIGVSQGIFTFNPYKWSKKIDPLEYREAKRQYLQNVEQIAITATSYFFNLLVSQIQMKIALQNAANYDTIYKIGLGRYNLGKIPENDLLQMELSLLRAQAEVENTAIELENRMFQLKSFLRLQDDRPVELVAPVEDVSFFDIEMDKAILMAKQNNSKTLEFERRLLQADMDVNYAQLNERFSAVISAQYGLTQSAYSFDEVYEAPQDQQLLTVGIHIPILDWGLSKGNIKVAESNREIVRTAVEQERIDFEQNVYLEVANFMMQQRQLEIAAKADTVAGKGFEVAKQRYMIGKISITDLTTAQINNDNARISYARSLQEYWINYYQLRQVTLYDFKYDHEISIDFDKLR